MKNSKLKKFLHKFFKIFIIFMIGTAVINIVLFLVIFLNHQNKLNKEEGLLVPPGEMVEVNGHDMHVIKTGNEKSQYTLVFLHNSGIVDDSVALIPLFDELKEEFQLIYVDRSGVGYSEVSESPRDIETMTEETRMALSKVGVEDNIIIVPLGTAGIEAIHWANTYPDEIDGIIGINMNYPEQFEDITVEEYCGFFDYLMMGFTKIGGIRLVPSAYPNNDFGLYTDAQMRVRKALISRGFYTKDMYNEDMATIDNAAKVTAEGMPDEQMYLIYSNPLMEPYVNESESVNEQYNDALEENSEVDYIDEYNKPVKEYFSGMDNVVIDEISGPARVYIYCPEEVAKLIKDYVNNEMLQ